MEFKKTWLEIKTMVLDRHLSIQYTESETEYYIWLLEEYIKYFCVIDIEDNPSEQQLDFENNYKDDANKAIVPISEDNKKIVRAESRPLNTTTWFTCRGDSEAAIGKGKEFYWDFSTSEDTVETVDGYKKKRIEFSFIDAVSVKEGTLYFHNAEKKSVLDMMVVCPTGTPYLNNSGEVNIATEDTVIDHYVNNVFFQGSAPMGDELNTESCSCMIPNYYKFWIDITVPDTDVTSNGYVELELYRKRTVIL